MSLGFSSPTGTSNSDDQDLWSELQQGQVAALARLYDRHAGLVYGIAMQVLGNPQEAEDLTQDIFIRLVDRQHSHYDSKRGSLRTYLAVLTRSRAIDRLRSRRTQASAIERVQNQVKQEATEDPPIASLGAAETSAEVQKALAQLPESQQQVLRLAYYEGLSQSDIAERLSEPLGTIKARARRGLLKLRQMLQDDLS
ncbi:sigma-70 family RNA polymerase sigma factor [Synechococcus elongatus]|uniref:Sigma-24 (FecI-like) n=2 Tax=Synechococcus elongatus TaxID=32046 RepID=Q31LN5_SYNE7|nr:sigma-70 family RNA polymerase sigma factor [Synechococcus elongatus]ABB58034.1 sigma-24 (FecI-like) [Synechococcus elongatus PCC 7942 = FACHB-805]AJD57489.1 RNA polymerase sigma factor [Synechococcus elongatus UTEX 2973]MBD2586753.1 sigma-70 family RNA polymerase sigma factor [Synechococcus elongatus FACHB-242]MBD2687823.1 sigma-70 family RNA polymerase sigma factor [Synechococcus elongatus FACHB-1061]MBD2706465.1 sigma-70 family RNA polymerase sigma factor [Synechococcus elongatus PCC 794